MTNQNTYWVLILAVALIFIAKQPVSEVPASLPLSQTIDSGVQFNGQDIYSSSTSLSSEWVRVMKFNGEDKNLGWISANSGTLSTQPNSHYKFYFFLNSTSYYPFVYNYTAPEQDAVDNIVGKGCKFDTPTVIVRDVNGNTQTASSNALSISANEEKTVTVEITSHPNKCYGMPGVTNIGNVICFAYDSSIFTKVKAQTYSYIPQSVTNNISGSAISCYQFDLIKNGQSVTIPVTLTSGGSEPTISHNLTILIDDISMDLNADNLNEIIGYTDESGNQLGATLVDGGKVYIS